MCTHTLRTLRHAASFVREGSEEIHCNVEYFKEIKYDAPQKWVQVVHEKFSLGGGGELSYQNLKSKMNIKSFHLGVRWVVNYPSQKVSEGVVTKYILFYNISANKILQSSSKFLHTQLNETAWNVFAQISQKNEKNFFLCCRCFYVAKQMSCKIMDKTQ